VSKKAAKPSLKSEAWALFDRIVAPGEGEGDTNPWRRTDGGGLEYYPDYPTLQRLLAVSVQLGAASQSGVPALALDVWTAHELRRAGSTTTGFGPGRHRRGSFPQR
jgi:hypothetical protein